MISKFNPLRRFVVTVCNRIPYVDRILEKRRYKRKIDYRLLSQDELIKKLMDRYEKKMGYRMDIMHPITYTEKIQWYKIFYTQKDGQDLIRVVDKYLFKDYIKEQIGEGYTIPLYGVYENIEDMVKGWHLLPQEFVLKSTLSSNGHHVKFIHNKFGGAQLNQLKEELNNWFKSKNMLCNSLCRAYHSGIPRIIAEKYIENAKDQLFDYKFYCFDGKPFCIETCMERFLGGVPPFTFYDLDWKKMDVQSGNHPHTNVPKPKHFDEMLELSKRLSKGFPHVRVDFFDTDDKLYVAEMTLYTAGGYQKYTPDSFNVKMGELFRLPIDSR